jgi:hypothetical protein
VSSAGGLTALAVTVVAAAGCLRTPGGGDGADRSALVTTGIGIVIGVAILALAAGSAIAYEEPIPVARDVRLLAFRHDCAPRTLKAAPGQVSNYVRNEDGSRRSLEIAELGVVLTVPAHRAARTEFTAGPGRYVYACHVPGRGNRIWGELLVG